MAGINSKRICQCIYHWVCLKPIAAILGSVCFNRSNRLLADDISIILCPFLAAHRDLMIAGKACPRSEGAGEVSSNKHPAKRRKRYALSRTFFNDLKIEANCQFFENLSTE